MLNSLVCGSIVYPNVPKKKIQTHKFFRGALIATVKSIKEKASDFMFNGET